MNGFNPNFVFLYESGTSIKVTFNNFTTNNTECIIMSHDLLPSDKDEFLPIYFSKISFSSSI